MTCGTADFLDGGSLGAVLHGIPSVEVVPGGKEHRKEDGNLVVDVLVFRPY